MENVCSLLNKKFKLLNTTYSLFESNELIIIISELYNEILINDENLYEGIIYTIKTLYSGNEYTIKFDEIHLLFQDLLLSIKTLDWNYKKFPLKTLLN